MGRCKAMWISSLPLAGLLGVVFVFDFIAAASTNWLFLSVVGLLAVFSAGAAWAGTRRAECLLALLPFAVMLMLLSLLDITPLKPFARFYAAIEPGMTEAEVIRLLDNQFPPTSCYPRPLINRLVGPNHLGFILNPNDGRYDSEIVALDFVAGRAVKKQYYPD